MAAIGGFVSFNPDKDIPSLQGKVILVTGGTAGIGKWTVISLAKHSPSHIYFTGRNANAAESLLRQLGAAYPNLSVTFIRMDLSSLGCVKAAAARIPQDRLDILICNGGILDVAPAVSVDGYEIHMATNHLGHAMLVRELLPILLRTADRPGSDVRLVVLSSTGHAFHSQSGVSWEKAKSSQSKFTESIYRYGQSKLANLVYAAELSRRYPTILTVSIHPGFVATDLVHNAGILAKTFMYGRHWLKGIAPVSPEQGCYNQLWAAVGQEREKIVNGAYYTPIGMFGEVVPLGKDDQFARKLWDWTNQALDSI